MLSLLPAVSCLLCCHGATKEEIDRNSPWGAGWSNAYEGSLFGSEYFSCHPWALAPSSQRVEVNHNPNPRQLSDFISPSYLSQGVTPLWMDSTSCGLGASGPATSNPGPRHLQCNPYSFRTSDGANLPPHTPRLRCRPPATRIRISIPINSKNSKTESGDSHTTWDGGNNQQTKLFIRPFVWKLKRPT